jgi:hypothetical protein
VDLDEAETLVSEGHYMLGGEEEDSALGILHLDPAHTPRKSSSNSPPKSLNSEQASTSEEVQPFPFPPLPLACVVDIDLKHTHRKVPRSVRVQGSSTR